MSKLTFYEALEDIKSSGEVEKTTIEIADELVRIIDELTELRLNSGITQHDLAEKTGLKQSAISRLESLDAIPRLDTVIRIARCLNAKIKIDSSSEEITLENSIIPLALYASNTYEWRKQNSINQPLVSCGKEHSYGAIG